MRKTIHRMIIRKATPDDIEQLAGLWSQLMEQHDRYHRLFQRAPDFDTLVRKDLAAFIANEKMHLFVADENGKLAGCLFATIKPHPPALGGGRKGYIGETVVDQAARGRGISTALVKKAYAWFRSENCSIVELEVSVVNEPSKRFWEAQGFTPLTLHMVRELN